MSRRIACVLLLMFMLISEHSSAAGPIQKGDLMQMYLNNDTTPSRGQISYGFGVNLPAPYTEGTGGTVLSLSAGVKRGKSCSAIDIVGELSGLFNAEMMGQYVKGLAASVVNSAPLLITCYASQTMCDLYKHFRAMANAALEMRQKNCQQLESLAVDTGTSLRNKAIMECISEKQASMPYEQATKECGSIEVEGSVPWSQTDKAKTFNLSTLLANSASTSPEMQNFIQGILGDVTFSYNAGIYTEKKQTYGMEKVLGELTRAYSTAFRDVVEQSIASKTPATPNDLRQISIPGVPVDNVVVSRLTGLDPSTRNNFYQSYGTMAAMFTLLHQLEQATEELENAKASAQNKDLVAALEEGIKAMDRRYQLLERKLALQKEYAMPMFQALMSSQPKNRTGGFTNTETDYFFPPRLEKKP